jgi:hypothetical protein
MPDPLSFSFLLSCLFAFCVFYCAVCACKKVGVSSAGEKADGEAVHQRGRDSGQHLLSQGQKAGTGGVRGNKVYFFERPKVRQNSPKICTKRVDSL